MPKSILAHANKLLGWGETESAVNLVTEAAGNGDGAALYELARWRVYGQPIPRDFTAARTLLERSAWAGHPFAARTHAVFMAIGAGGPSDWPAAMRLIAKAAKYDVVAAREMALLDAMALDHNGMPTIPLLVEPVSQSPRLAMIRGLLTPGECLHIRALAEPLLTPSVVADPVSGQTIAHPVRTSDGAVLGPLQMDLVVEALNRRIAAVTGTAVEQGEPLTVLRYTPGQQYRLHHDCLPGEGNQREQTLIAFLNEDFDGGETHFPAIDTAIRGSTGDAISFTNLLEEGGVDQASSHAGLPVIDGEKWICTRWIRSRPFDPWGMRRP